MAKHRTNEEAIKFVAAQSKSGKAFRVGLCKLKTREAFDVVSDGAVDATEGWSRTDHRIDVPGDKAPRGAILWWTGGSSGHGHAAIADGKGGVWSVDIKRRGFWDNVPFETFAQKWPKVRFAGVSADIDGVKVIDVPTGKKVTKTPIQQARDQYRQDRVIDLHLLDDAILSGRPGAAKVKKARDRIEAAMTWVVHEVRK